MESFKLFFEQTEEQQKNVKMTLAKLPTAHQKLIAKYKIKWHCDSTLSGDNKHVGIINPHTNTITIAASWKYPQQWVFLHEIGHLVWASFINPVSKITKYWDKLVKQHITPEIKKRKEDNEEIWCHCYAAAYCDHPVDIFNIKPLVEFIKTLG
jgi:hypothetical protein